MAQNVEAWTLLALALVVIAFRVYVRWTLVGPSGFQLDDYLMPLAGVRDFSFPIPPEFELRMKMRMHQVPNIVSEKEKLY